MIDPMMAAVCTQDPEYGRKLAEFASSSGDYPFTLQNFTKPEALPAYARQHKLFAVLLSEEYYRKEDWTGFQGRLLLITRSALPPENMDSLYFYQSAQDSLRQVCLILEATGEALPGEAAYGKVTVTGIYGTLSPCRSLNLALGLGNFYGGCGRTLMMDLQDWSPLTSLLRLEGAAGMSDFLYYQKSGSRKVWTKMGGRFGHAGDMHLLAGVTQPEDLKSMSEDDWQQFMAALRQQELFDRIILLLGDSVRAPEKMLSLCDRALIPMDCHPVSRLRAGQIRACFEKKLSPERAAGIQWPGLDECFDYDGKQTFEGYLFSEIFTEAVRAAAGQESSQWDR